jgi:hypothetical protein
VLAAPWSLRGEGSQIGAVAVEAMRFAIDRYVEEVYWDAIETSEGYGAIRTTRDRDVPFTLR